MAFPPLHVAHFWRHGLLAAGLLGSGAYLLGKWHGYRRALRRAPPGHPRGPGHPALLAGGLALGAWCLGGGRLFERLRRRNCPADWPEPIDPGEVRCLRCPDGTEVHVVLHGPPDGPPVVLTPGWGADTGEWAYTVRDLAGRYRLITWDLPGLGESSPPCDGDWSLGRVAADLRAVLDLAGGRGAVLVGHSLGAMIVLDFCRLFPQTLGHEVAGLVLGHVTYTNPVLTTARPRLTTALQKPVFEPLCHLTAAASPLVRVLAWLSYLDGSAHRSLASSLFSGNETWEQVEYLARYYLQSSPGAAAHYTLAMFGYDVTATLGRITVPTLIVAGDGDRNCTPAVHEFMARAIPGARLLMLRPARHGGLLEHYRAFDRALAEFTDACAGAGSPAPAGRF
jgi:pimeloyl-ACP methyl ester carboxylesterase